MRVLQMWAHLKAILEGKWLGHPLHPVMVSLPFGLWPAALILDLLSLGGEGPAMLLLSNVCILLGLVGALAAIPTGLADWSEIKPGRPAKSVGLWHMILNSAATVIWLANLAVRWWWNRDATRAAAVPLALSFVGTALVVSGGFLGGHMTYGYGIAVARFSKKKWQAAAERSHARLPEKKGQADER